MQNNIIKHILLIVCFLLIRANYLQFVHCTGLKVEFTWSKLNYIAQETLRGIEKPSSEDAIIFPSDLEKYTASSSEKNKYINENYIYENNIPMGANRWKNKLFITVPRRRFGIPSTLNYIDINSSARHNVPLIPYPDLQTNLMRAPREQEHLVSVYRVAIDPCDRLWMVDTGIVEAPNNRTRIGPQRIVIIDLNTDTIIKTYNFKDTDLTSVTVLSLPTVDVTADACDDAYAYFPDYAGFGLIVYSLKQNDSWRIRHNYFHLEPDAGEFHIGGVHFQWTDGAFSGGLTHILPNGYRNYIFHAMAGTHLYSVSTRILRNKQLATRSFHYDDFKNLGDRGRGWQTSASDLHQASGTLFLALVNQNGVGCWNIKRAFEQQSFGIVHKDADTMIYPSDLKIYKDDIIVLTNSMPVFVYSKLNYEKINFRIWMNNVYEASENTPCEIQNN